MRTMIFTGLIIGVCIAGLSQSVAPAFDVASVKLVPASQGVPPGFSISPRRSGGRLTWTTTRGSVIYYAYHLPSWRVSGLNIDSSFHTIEATMDEASTDEQVRLMMQKLLADRFKMTAHRETKELQGYALVLAGKEPKVKESVPGGEAPLLPDYLKGKPAAAFDNQIFTSMEGPGVSAITGRGVSMSRLAETVSEILSAFVEDKTGLSGKYYFGFRFLRDVGATASSAPSLPAALQEELGLKLEKQKGPVEILVIDHIEKMPIEN